MSAPGITQSTATACESTFHNGAIGRANAWFFDAFDRYINFISRRHKGHAFADIDAGTVVEIGAGVGANFAYLPHDGRVIAVEPNEAMHQRLAERASRRGIELELVGAPAERLPLADDSVDTVICSLVLCTVDEPAAVVAEIRRVLRPGGTFRFVEHVAARPVSPRRWLQASIARPWSWLFEGCRLCQDTGTLIESAGFDDVVLWHQRLRHSAFIPVNSAISGRATQPHEALSSRSTGAAIPPTPDS